MVEIRSLNGKVIYTNKDIDTLYGADLRGADLRGADLRDADLSNADLSNANLSCANLSNTTLRYANVSNVDLSGADLSFANLSFANLRGADLIDANLSFANLSFANLIGVNLIGVNLYNADLRGANLSNIIYDTTTLFFSLQCPEEGSFIAWKKIINKNVKFLIKLEIPADAERSSATSRKCRCSKAKVLGIYNRDKELLDIQEITNYRYRGTAYKVGEMVYPDSWDSNRWNECSHGIHFFLTFNEAKNY